MCCAVAGPSAPRVTSSGWVRAATKKSENASAGSGEAEDVQTAAEDIECRNTTHTLAKDGEHRKEYDYETGPEYNLLYMVKRVAGLNLASWLNYGCGIIAAFSE